MSLTKEDVVTCSSCGQDLPMGLPEGFCPKCALEISGQVAGRSEAAPELEEASEKAPERIGKYRILKELGEGGFGIVYMAEQKEPVRRRVALKVLKRGMDTRQVVTRFEVERQALALMDHPNVARVFDGGETEDGRPFFAMEYVDGVPITQFCDDQQMSIPQRLELLIQVCRGLQHSHHKGLIHRDVKPSNILVTTQDGHPVPKIIDFGIAKVTTYLSKNTLFTESGKLVGTPVYMSPEQLRLDSLDVDVRTDIYSLGAMLYELLTGATPFDHKKLMALGFAEMERTIREQDPPKPSLRLSLEHFERAAQNRGTTAARLRAALRRELDWIVMRAMAKSRERRYQTAADLADDLTRYLKGEPVKAGPPTLKYRASKFVRRHSGRLAGAAVVLVGGIAMIAYNIVSARRGEEERALRMVTGREAKTALLPFYLPEMRPHLDNLADKLHAIAIDSTGDPPRKLHAAIAALPKKPDLITVLLEGLLTIDPTDPLRSEDLWAAIKILEKYRNDGDVDDGVWKRLMKHAWDVVNEAAAEPVVPPPDGELARLKVRPLAAAAVMAQLDPDSPGWNQELLKKVVEWSGSLQPLPLSQLRRFLVPVLKPVHFRDPILTKAMTETVGRPDEKVMDFDVMTLRHFKSESKQSAGIRDLKGLEVAINLEKLDLDYNEIDNLSVLRSLTKMRELDLDQNRISDLGPLSEMTNLRMLDIRDNKDINDFAPLEKLTNLEEVQILRTLARDSWKALEKLVKLKSLELTSCKVTDISFVKHMTRLERLDLSSNEITDLTPIAELENLVYLDISDNKITDPKPLLNLQKIRRLKLIMTGNEIPEDEENRFWKAKENAP